MHVCHVKVKCTRLSMMKPSHHCLYAPVSQYISLIIMALSYIPKRP